MTISTQRTRGLGGLRGTARHAFTLTEVIVAGTLASFVLAGVLSAFLMIGRTAYSASNYSEMEAQVRRALEIFGADARKAADVRWNSSQSVTLFVASLGSATHPVTYGYEPSDTSRSHGNFYRVAGDIASTLPRTVLVREVAPDFAFDRFKLEQSGITDNSATNDLETKQLQITFRAGRQATTTVAQTQGAVSARYILRNKRVSN